LGVSTIKKLIPFIIIAVLITALSIAGFVAGAYLAAGLMFGCFVIIPSLLIAAAAITAYRAAKYSKHRTINHFILFWFFIVSAIGAGAGSFMLYTGIIESYILLLVFGGIFITIGIGGLTGFFINLFSHFRLRYVIKNGTETTGIYVNHIWAYSTGKYRYKIDMSFKTVPNRHYSIIFKFNNGNEWIETKTNGVYTGTEAEYYSEKKEFLIRYHGNRAVIIESIQQQDENENIPPKNEDNT
jgi:hypothetical protein